MKNFSELEEVTNDLLIAVRELEYRILAFGEKSNSSNALKVRNLIKTLSTQGKEFNNKSIYSFKKRYTGTQSS
jgi:hypothetical protein